MTSTPAPTCAITITDANRRRLAAYIGREVTPEDLSLTTTLDPLAVLLAIGVGSVSIEKAIAALGDDAIRAAALEQAAGPDAMARAADRPKGLRGMALALHVLGEATGETIAKARTTRAATAPKAKAATASGPRPGSAISDALVILKAAKNPLTVAEVYERAQKRGLMAGLKGKTPLATLSARLSTDAKKPAGVVERTGPATYAPRKAS